MIKSSKVVCSSYYCLRCNHPTTQSSSICMKSWGIVPSNSRCHAFSFSRTPRSRSPPLGARVGHGFSMKLLSCTQDVGRAGECIHSRSIRISASWSYNFAISRVYVRATASHFLPHSFVPHPSRSKDISKPPQPKTIDFRHSLVREIPNHRQIKPRQPATIDHRLLRLHPSDSWCCVGITEGAVGGV